MPAWIHDRAQHILRKNPDMDESQAFAIATQQAHALKKAPKGYGTSEGRAAARRKYRTPSDDVKTADPASKEAMWIAFNDELVKLGAFPSFGTVRQAAGRIPGLFRSGLRNVGSAVRSFASTLRPGGMSFRPPTLPSPAPIRSSAPMKMLGGPTPAPNTPSTSMSSGQTPPPTPPRI